MKRLIFVSLGLLLLFPSCKAQQQAGSATNSFKKNIVVTSSEPKQEAVATPTTVEIISPILDKVETAVGKASTPEQVTTPPKGMPVAEDYGTIKGKVVYEGGYVHKALSVIKDEHTCGLGDVIDESLVTSADGGVQWAVVSIASEIKGGKGLDALQSDRILDQTMCIFSPHVLLVGVNQELTINNLDKTLHNVRTVSFMNDVVNKVQMYIPNMPQASDKVTFSEPEVVEIVCDVHGWMKAYVHVVEHPYYSVTNEEGVFELTKVPPGNYTLKVTHEKLGEMEQTVEVKAGETAEVSFSYKAIKE
jgi:plastocyanin